MYNPIRTFHHDARPHAIAWSPETSLSVVPKILTFCVAGADFKIRLYNSNLNDLNVYEVRIFIILSEFLICKLLNVILEVEIFNRF